MTQIQRDLVRRQYQVLSRLECLFAALTRAASQRLTGLGLSDDTIGQDEAEEIWDLCRWIDKHEEAQLFSERERLALNGVADMLGSNEVMPHKTGDLETLRKKIELLMQNHLWPRGCTEEEYMLIHYWNSTTESGPS